MKTRTDGGEVVAVADIADVMGAIEAVDLDAPWHEAAPGLRLALPRRRPLPPGTGDLPSQVYPPGIRAVLSLDIGPALLFVREEQLESWGVTADHAFQRALANVRQRIRRRRQFALVSERVCGEPTVAFQSREGWASSLLLMPEDLCRVLGQRDGLVVAPMRDLVIHMPLDADPLLALFMLEEFAAEDPNALDLPVFSLLDGQLTIAGMQPGAAAIH